MQSSPPLDLGFVSNLAVIKRPGSEDLLMLVGQSKDSGRWVKIVTKGAAQTLWVHLTQYLYPRAAQQLTSRAATAVLQKSSSPMVTTFLEVFNMDDKQVIRVHGIGGAEEWLMYFTHDEGFELWASLEKILNVV
jgi:hypothetical protein